MAHPGGVKIAHRGRVAAAVLGLLAGLVQAQAPTAGPRDASMQPIGSFEIDRTEVTIGAFRAFVQATGTRTKAERDGGGLTYEAGWEKRPGWVWHSPYGTPGDDQEPAVHVTHGEAQAYCRWAGKRLPTETEWREAAYTERRERPTAPFVNGRRYPYPTGDSPQGANCSEGCGDLRTVLADPRQATSRGRGHAEAGSTRAGVNGLTEMAANVWEWTDDGSTSRERPTRGGSWWYGASPMQRDHRATKPADMAVVYIGFRCARSR